MIFTLSSVLPPPHLQFSAYPPTQCPSFGEHDAHFVGEPHDIGSVLPSYVWKALVHYTGKAVSLFPYAMSLAKTLQVDFICSFVSRVERFPRGGINVASPLAGLDASLHPLVGCLRLEQEVHSPLRAEGRFLVQRRLRSLRHSPRGRRRRRLVRYRQSLIHSPSGPMESTLWVVPHVHLLETWLAYAPPIRHTLHCRAAMA